MKKQQNASNEFVTKNTRDQATAVLRKLGMNKTDYNSYIEADESGFKVFVVAAKQDICAGIIEGDTSQCEDAPKAEQTDESVAEPVVNSKKAKKAKTPPPSKVAAKEKLSASKRTQKIKPAGYIRACVLAGDGMAAIIQGLRDNFPEVWDDAKVLKDGRYFINWTKSDLIRKGNMKPGYKLPA